MARTPQADPTGWTKSPDDLAYEELLARYAVDLDPEAPGPEESGSLGQPAPPQKGEGWALLRLLRDIGSPREGKYARRRRDPSPAEPTDGWAVSGTGTTVSVQAPPEQPPVLVTPAAPVRATVSEEAVRAAKEAALAAKEAAEQARRAAAIQAAAPEAAAPDLPVTAPQEDAGEAPAGQFRFGLGSLGKKRAPKVDEATAAVEPIDAEVLPDAPTEKKPFWRRAQENAVPVLAEAVIEEPGVPETAMSAEPVNPDTPKEKKPLWRRGREKAAPALAETATEEAPVREAAATAVALLEKAPVETPPAPAERPRFGFSLGKAHPAREQAPKAPGEKQPFLPRVRHREDDPSAEPLPAASLRDLAPAHGGAPALSQGHALAAAGTMAAAAASQTSQALGVLLDRMGVTPYLDWAHEETYYLGMQILRTTHTLRRRAASVVRWVGVVIPGLMQQRSQRIAIWWRRFCDSTLFPYQDISFKTGQLVRDLEQTRGSARLDVFWRYLLSLGRPLNRIANFLAPIVGCTVLAACITYFSSLTYGLSVEYAGEHLGFISDENIFYSAQNSVRERLIDEDYLSSGNAPSFQLTVVQPDSLLDRETLANRLLEASNNEVQTADGIYVEGAFLGAVQDGREFLVYLDGLLEDYRTGRDHETVQFIKGISVRNGIFPVSSVRSLTDIRDTLNSDQPLETVHTVKADEDLASIAAKYNTSIEQLLALNPTLEERLTMEETASTGNEAAMRTLSATTTPPVSVPLVQGEELLVARVDPGLGIQVTWREVYDEEIPFGTDYVENNNMYEGWTQTISAGVKGTREVTADVTYIDGEKVDERRVDTQVTQEPVNQRVSRGTKKIVTKVDPNGATAGSFVWPVRGGKYSGTYYGHTGMDIQTPIGTPVYASRPGTVTTAVNWAQWPYGKQVVVNHGDGFITRYAHMSAVNVYVGQWVDQGTLLGLSGNTGNTTGPHVHFEIKLYGQFLRPEGYIGRAYNGVWGW